MTDDSILIALLKAKGPISQAAIRKATGWDIEHLAVVRARLLAKGKILIGSGRGGTLRLSGTLSRQGGRPVAKAPLKKNAKSDPRPKKPASGG